MGRSGKRSKIVIMGAAGRDFHNFNVAYRNCDSVEVSAFTGAQIPGIVDRHYPASLSGPLYPNGIPIIEQSTLGTWCREKQIDEVVFAYSDVLHSDVMHHASTALALGATFTLLGPKQTMLQSRLPVIAVCAVRTGCGKSQVARWLSQRLSERGLTVAVIRHPMPYGDLATQAVQRFASRSDLDEANCTVEEREEYEPHLESGNIVFAGVDYGAILAQAEEQADLILWDGGNNDFSFYEPDLHLVVLDPLRAGHEMSHHPGEAVFRMADLLIVNKSNSATEDQMSQVLASAQAIKPGTPIVRGQSFVTLEDPVSVRGRRVLVLEDGPTITHGGMPYGAGYVAATAAGAAQIIDPRRFARGQIADLYQTYPHIGPVLPAVGYSGDQLAALRDCMNASDADVIVSATPCDIAQLVRLETPVVRARYEYVDQETAGLEHHLDTFLTGLKTRSGL